MDLIFVNLIFVIILLIIFWVRFRKERFSIFKRNGIPGPEPNFWWGNIKDIIQMREDCISEYVKKFGNITGFFLGAKPLLIVTDQELMKEIQVKESNKFLNKDMILRDGGIPQPEFMKSMIALFGEEWKKNRSLVSPSFSTSKLKKLMPILNDTIDIFMEIIGKSSKEGHIDISEIIENLTLDIITKAAIGIDTGVQHAAKSKLLDSAKLFVTIDTSHFLPMLSLCFPEFEPLPTKLRNIIDTLKYSIGLTSIKHLHTHVQRVMDYRRKFSQKREDMLQGLMDEKTTLKKLLSTKTEELVASDDNKETEKTKEMRPDLHPNSNENISLSDESIIGTTGFLLIAGFDTTSLTLSYLAFYLAKYQKIQDRLREEINTQVSGKDIVYNDLSKFSYMEQVISETLRLHSTSMLAINRIVNDSFAYKDMTIPKGVTVIMPPSHLHRNPNYWPDPEKFDPERFSPENKAKIHPYIYQPFGNGPRNCVGMRFAQVVLKLVLARLIRSYKIKRCSNKDIEMKHGMFLHHPKNILVKLEPIYNSA